MGVKVYVASALAEYQRVKALQDLLRAAGAEVTFDWASLYGRQQEEGYVPDSPTLVREMADGVRCCDVLLLVLPGRRGAHVEFGMALGLGKRCVVLAMNTEDLIKFHWLGQVCMNQETALRLVLDG